MNFDIKVIHKIREKSTKNYTEICMLRLYLELCVDPNRSVKDLIIISGLDRGTYNYAAKKLKEWFDIEHGTKPEPAKEIEATELPDAKRAEIKIKHNLPYFEGFWKHYPKKTGKDAAKKMWNRLAEKQYESIKKTIPDIGQGVAAYLIYIKHHDTEKKYIQNPATFLNPDNKNYLKENWEIKEERK